MLERVSFPEGGGLTVDEIMYCLLVKRDIVLEVSTHGVPEL